MYYTYYIYFACFENKRKENGKTHTTRDVNPLLCEFAYTTIDRRECMKEDSKPVCILV